MAWIFLRINWRAWIFFHLIFFVLRPPPISFLMVRPLSDPDRLCCNETVTRSKSPIFSEVFDGFWCSNYKHISSGPCRDVAEKVTTYFFCAFPLRPCLALLAHFTLAFARFCSSEKGEKITPQFQLCSLLKTGLYFMTLIHFVTPVVQN